MPHASHTLVKNSPKATTNQDKILTPQTGYLHQPKHTLPLKQWAISLPICLLPIPLSDYVSWAEILRDDYPLDADGFRLKNPDSANRSP